MIARCKISSYLPQRWIATVVFATVAFSTHAIASVRVLVDQVGYEPQAANPVDGDSSTRGTSRKASEATSLLLSRR